MQDQIFGLYSGRSKLVKPARIVINLKMPFLPSSTAKILLANMIALLVMMAPAFADSTIPATDTQFNDLKARLSADGFTPDHLNQLYSTPEVTFDTHSVALFFMHSEARLNYDQFTDNRNIRKARDYMQQHAAMLAEAENRFGTDKEIITAIILVETKLGTYLGKSYVLNTLSTLAALQDPALREVIWSQIPKDRRFSRDKFEKRAQQKSQWAYKELKALLTYTQKEGINAPSIRGSYAGAMGISQFYAHQCAHFGPGRQSGRTGRSVRPRGCHHERGQLPQTPWLVSGDRL